MTKNWWKQAVVYQIYPKSFNDTTGSGTGDLPGIIEKLDYLYELGIDVIWLTPVYESPQRDNGYDISNYYAIDKRYGTMEDFEQLLTKVHQRGMRLIMDLVVNHTSTEHKWFKQAASSKENPYRNFYIWKDAKEGGPPNNWQSKFGGSAWQWDDKTEQYYLHLFDQTQADLNWENPILREKVFDMMRFWAKKGIDGFRLDVINLISKDQRFPNDSDGDGRKFYTDGPKIHEYLHEMNQKVLTPYKLLTVGEMSSTSLEHCIQYTNPENEELNMVFQFHHLKVDYPNGEKWTKADFDFLQLKDILSEWQVGMHNGNGWNALFWCNHDQPRAISRFGDDHKYWKESAKMLATTLHMMQGTPYIYQGEEIGMTNPNFDQIEQYRDVESINAYKTLRDKGVSEEETMAILQQKSRDNARTPMQWDHHKHAGFTEGTPWIDVAPNYKTVNVLDQLNDKESILNYYKSLIELRKTYDIVVHGDFQLLLRDDPHVFAYVRRYREETLLVVSHFYHQETHVSLDIPHEQTDILLSNYEGSSTNINNLVLRPYESIIYLLR